MHLDVLKFHQAVNVPVGAAQIVLTLRVLYQINFFGDFDGVTIWNKDDFAELAYDVAWVWKINSWVVFHLLIQGKVFMRLTHDKWPRHKRFFDLLRNFFWLLPLAFVLSIISLFVCQLSAIFDNRLTFTINFSCLAFALFVFVGHF